MPRPDAAPALWVVAGPNGAGKSTIVGEMIRQSGGHCFDPDQLARRLRDLQPRLSPEGANEAAWQQGRKMLERRIHEKKSYAFETTLGGHTIAALLHRAADAGFRIRMWFLALESADLHVERVRARTAAGGHDIDEELICERYVRSRHNLVVLLPRLAALKVYDNSTTVAASAKARPRLVLDWRDGRIVNRETLRETPPWARAIVAAALAADGRAASL